MIKAYLRRGEFPKIPPFLKMTYNSSKLNILQSLSPLPGPRQIILGTPLSQQDALPSIISS